jgi:Ca2+-binding RTX toxin-like protein
MASFPGTDSNDTLVGGVDADILNSGWLAGDDQLIGADGDDTYHVNSSGDDVIEGNGAASGNDTVESQVASYTLTANVENLVLRETDAAGILQANGTILLSLSLGPPTAVWGTGNVLDNQITGNSNGNLLYGVDGDDTLLGGKGDDLLFGGNDDDLLKGEADADDLYGGAGDDTLNGGGGADYLSGWSENDSLIGGSGADTLVGGTGDDTLKGNTGNDLYVVEEAGDVVVEAANSGTDTVDASVSWTLGANVEALNLTGTSALSGTGNSLDNTIVGNSAGNVIDGQGGADTMEGGGGNDIYYVDNANDSVVEAAGGGIDLAFASVTHTAAAEVESVYLTGSSAINATGNGLANFLYGNSAANTVRGNGGGDTLYGYGGNDTVTGGSGADTINGGLGNDALYANTTAVAADGAVDRFVFNTALDPSANVDQIILAEFVAGAEATDDEIVLDNAIFTALTASGGGNVGTLRAADFNSGALLDGNGQFDIAGIYFDTNSGDLYYNPTSNVAGDSVHFAVVNIGTLSNTEFTLE